MPHAIYGVNPLFQPQRLVDDKCPARRGKQRWTGKEALDDGCGLTWVMGAMKRITGALNELTTVLRADAHPCPGAMAHGIGDGN